MFGSDSHRRCESIETLLRERIIDLEERNRQLLDRLEDQARTNAMRENELADRYMAAVNPAALHAMVAAQRAATPAAPMPSMLRNAATAAEAARSGVGSNPRLTPQQANFGRTAAASGSGTRAQTIPTAAVPNEDAE